MAGDAVPEARWERPAVALLLAWFAVRVGFFALRIDPSVPPDEATHFGRCLAYAGALFLPSDGPATAHLGVLTHRPFLYYLVMGKLLALNATPLHDLFFLRLANALLGLGTAVTVWRLARLVTGDPLVRVVAVAFATNVLMFTAVAASVSYDNAANLLGAVACFHAFAFLRGRRPANLAAFAVAILAGTLTKRSLLPLLALLAGILLWRERRALGALVRCAPRAPVLSAGAAVLLLANLAVYGGNVLRFASLSPDPVAILGEEAALSNRIFARDWIVERFRDGEISYAEAVALTGRIEHEGDRRAARTLLAAARHPEAVAAGIQDRVRYANVWGHLMVSYAVGYHGHRRLVKRGPDLYPYFAVLFVAGFFFVRKGRRGDGHGLLMPAAVVVFGYAAVLMWGVNYPEYQRTGELWLGLQGRYLFPVWAPLCTGVAYYLLAYLPAGLRGPVAAAAAAWFLYGDLPYFLLHAEPAWYLAPPP